ncbi:MAG: energy transducer TonB [Candidatus Kapabacteria bacterium]|nr:energy transducer TonB [Candidatus Kapabacteria bacterium]
MRNQSVAIAVPEPSSYGAVELKVLISKFTVRGFIYSISLFLLIMIIYISVMTVQNMKSNVMIPKVINTINIADETNTPPPIDLAPPVVTAGIATTAGDFVASLDPTLSADSIANFNEIQAALSTSGNSKDLENLSAPLTFDDGQPQVNVTIREEDPDPNQFINVEREPQVDWDRLNRLVEYPSAARKLNIEGKVTLRLLIQKDGRVKKKIIEQSDSELLVDAAIKAVDKYGPFVPALQNKQPVTVWMVVPIIFKLRN